MERALTGIRPTGDLTIANYIGAMQQMLELQNNYRGDINVFVADLHALTDQEPETVNRTRLDIVKAYLASGIHPSRTNIYLQSQIGRQTVELASLLDRHITLAEIMRVPTLKDKLQGSQNEENATVALARYPILMAADIMIQDATDVPVGADQIPHIEVTRKLARRFNLAYGSGESILIEPEILAVEAIKIAALNGDSKMSKSKPSGAIFLKDSKDDVVSKIKKAKTDEAGVINDTLKSHFMIIEKLATDSSIIHELEDIKARHLSGERVMGLFKSLMSEVVITFLVDYQTKFENISDEEVKKVLVEGGEKAVVQSELVMGRVSAALGFVKDSFLYN